LMISGRGLETRVGWGVAVAVAVEPGVVVAKGKWVGLAVDGMGVLVGLECAGVQAFNSGPAARLPRPMADIRRKSRLLKGTGVVAIYLSFPTHSLLINTQSKRLCFVFPQNE
jgi:hypothetical protein